jgi:hypothetical protein
MFDFDKALMKIMAPFVALLSIMICIWGAIEILNHIWLELLLLLAIFGTIAIIIVLLWFRFRRW